ncbi:basic amino acid ABC transporter substrate-binding protein [Desulfocurvibacter africanus]|uniref:basic amino acid ABC transporter substrate-binding protein n=1 Tax=Desulfocurvibacter africanus TaxID=873 RepID=UPI002FDAC6C3
MLKKIISFLLLVVLAVPAMASAKDIVIASDATWPPMEMLDSSKKVVGFAPDMLQAIGKAAGFNPVIKNVAWDGIFAGLIAGKYDMVSSSVSITDERKNAMLFSEPYFEVKQAVIVQKGSGIKSAADLTGKTVGAQIGTTGYFAAKALKGVTAKTYDEVGLAIEDLYSGRINAVSCDDPVAANYALLQPEYSDKLEIAFILPSEEKEYYGFAFPKNKKGEENVALVNKGLAKIKADGTYDAIVKKWFSAK